jgi:hypothetical protein
MNTKLKQIQARLTETAAPQYKVGGAVSLTTIKTVAKELGLNLKQ